MQGNIASNPEMLSLFLKLQGVISSRKLIDEDKKRIQDFYDAAKNGESHTRFQQYDSPK